MLPSCFHRSNERLFYKYKSLYISSHIYIFSPSLQSKVYSSINYEGNEQNFCLTTNIIEILYSHSGAPEDAVLLECDALCLTEWYPTFRQTVLPS
jgi:hypothetical protein